MQQELGQERIAVFLFYHIFDLKSNVMPSCTFPHHCKHNISRDSYYQQQLFVFAYLNCLYNFCISKPDWLRIPWRRHRHLGTTIVWTLDWLSDCPRFLHGGRIWTTHTG